MRNINYFQWQVQAVLYSTHSALSVENQDMVTRMLNESNQLAAVRHQEEIRKQQIGVSGEIEESQPRTALVSLIPQAPGELLSLDEVFTLLRYFKVFINRLIE